MTKPLFLSALFMFLMIGAFSQKVESMIPKHRFIGLGASISNVAVKDQLNTSLPYSGTNFGLDFDFTTTFKRSFLQFKNIFSSGNLSPYKSGLTYNNKIDCYYENFSAAWYRNIFRMPENDFYIFVGPALNAKGGIRINNGEIGNSALTYEAAGSLALAAKAAKYFNVFSSANERNLKIEASLLLPLISKVYTPPYIGLPETLVQESSSIIELSHNYTGYFSNYFNLGLGLSMTYYLKNRNAIEISYFHDYTSTRPTVNPAKNLYQIVSFKLLYNLK